jgi:Zn finger protein HypA/HybF involved in hydrogenase expression
MGTWNHLNPKLFAFCLKHSTRATICIDNKDLIIAIARFQNGCLNSIWDAVWMIVQDRGQARESQMLQSVGVPNGKDFTRQCPAGKQQYLT